MKIGIVVHSQTGNTLSVAEQLKVKLVADGHDVTLERLTPVQEKSSPSTPVKLQHIPDVQTCDVVVLGAPVHAFSPSPPIKAYLAQLSSLKDKQVGVFVTQHFPYPWMGGSRSVKALKATCEAKGGDVFATGIINWSHKKREQRVADVVDSLLNGIRQRSG